MGEPLGLQGLIQQQLGANTAPQVCPLPERCLGTSFRCTAAEAAQVLDFPGAQELPDLPARAGPCGTGRWGKALRMPAKPHLVLWPQQTAQSL